MTSLHFSLPLPANLLSRTTPSRSSTHIMMNVRPLMPNCNLFFSPRDASLVETVCGGRTSYDGRCYKEALCWPHFPHGHQRWAFRYCWRGWRGWESWGILPLNLSVVQVLPFLIFFMDFFFTLDYILLKEVYFGYFLIKWIQPRSLPFQLLTFFANVVQWQ